MNTIRWAEIEEKVKLEWTHNMRWSLEIGVYFVVHPREVELALTDADDSPFGDLPQVEDVGTRAKLNFTYLAVDAPIGYKRFVSRDNANDAETFTWNQQRTHRL